jgi:hypothetical protein
MASNRLRHFSPSGVSAFFHTFDSVLAAESIQNALDGGPAAPRATFLNIGDGKIAEHMFNRFHDSHRFPPAPGSVKDAYALFKPLIGGEHRHEIFQPRDDVVRDILYNLTAGY